MNITNNRLTEMIRDILKSPEFKSETPEEKPIATADERAALHAAYETALRAENSDQELAGWRAEQARLMPQANEITRRGFVLGLINPQLAQQLHSLEAKVVKRARAYRDEADRQKARLLETLPDESKLKITSALERLEKLAKEACDLSKENDTNASYWDDGFQEHLKSFDSYKPVIQRLLHEEVPQASNALLKLKLSLLTGAALDAEIHAILSGLPPLKRARYKVDKQTRELVEA